MRASITFKFSGDIETYCVRTFREGVLDSRDLEAIVAALNEEIRLKRLIALGEIIPADSDPTGVGQLHVRWSN